MEIKKNLENNRVYTASQNELIVAQIILNNNGARNHVAIIGFDDDGNEVQLGIASAHFWTEANDWIRYNTVSVLVKKGQKYMVRTDFSAKEVYAYYTSIS